MRHEALAIVHAIIGFIIYVSYYRISIVIFQGEMDS